MSGRPEPERIEIELNSGETTRVLDQFDQFVAMAIRDVASES